MGEDNKKIFNEKAADQYQIGDLVEFIGAHPGHSSRVIFQFNLSADTGSNYNVTKTTTS